MADAYKGEVTVELDGSEYIIKCSLGARERMLETLETDESGLEEKLKGMNAHVLATMIWCMLTPRPDFSVDDIKEMFIPVLPAQISVMRAINLSVNGNKPSPLDELGEAKPNGEDPSGTVSETSA